MRSEKNLNEMIYSFSEYIRYLIFAAPVLIFAILAQIRVKSTYSKYSKIRNSRGLTGAAAAQLILKHYGITDVRIVPCAGELTDNYSPNEKMIRLSEKVYNSTSVAAIGIACHEAGHAAQHAEDYLPNKIRSALVPVTNFGYNCFCGVFSRLSVNLADRILRYNRRTSSLRSCCRFSVCYSAR